MIINAPIDLELTQLSGQTSQPPWKFNSGVYSDVVYHNGEAEIVLVDNVQVPSL